MADAITAYSQTTPTDATAGGAQAKANAAAQVDAATGQPMGQRATVQSTPTFTDSRGYALTSPTLTQQEVQNQIAAERLAGRIQASNTALATSGERVSSEPTIVKFGTSYASTEPGSVSYTEPTKISSTTAFERAAAIEAAKEPVIPQLTLVTTPQPYIPSPVRPEYAYTYYVGQSYVPSPLRPEYAGQYLSTGGDLGEVERPFDISVIPKLSGVYGTQIEGKTTRTDLPAYSLEQSSIVRQPTFSLGGWGSLIQKDGKLVQVKSQSYLQAFQEVKAREPIKIPSSNLELAPWVAGAAVLVAPALLGETLALGLAGESILAGAYGGAASYSTQRFEGKPFVESVVTAGGEALVLGGSWAVLGKAGQLLQGAKPVAKAFTRTTSEVQAFGEAEVYGNKVILATGESYSVSGKAITKSVFPLGENTGIKITTLKVPGTVTSEAREIAVAQARGSATTLGEGLFGPVSSKPVAVEAFGITEETAFIQREVAGKPFYRTEISAGSLGKFETGKAISTEVELEYSYAGKAGGKTFKYSAADLEKVGAVRPTFVESRGSVGGVGFSEKLTFYAQPQMKIEPLTSFKAVTKQVPFETATFSGLKVQPYALAQPITKGAGINAFELAKPTRAAEFKAPSAARFESAQKLALGETESIYGGQVAIQKEVSVTKTKPGIFSLQTDVSKAIQQFRLEKTGRVTSLFGSATTKVIGVKAGQTQTMSIGGYSTQKTQPSMRLTSRQQDIYSLKLAQPTASSFKLTQAPTTSFKLSSSYGFQPQVKTGVKETSATLSKYLQIEGVKQRESTLEAQAVKTSYASLTSTQLKGSTLLKGVTASGFSYGTSTITLTPPIPKKKTKVISYSKSSIKAFNYGGKVARTKQGVTVDYLSGFLTQLQTGKITTPTGAKAVSRFREQALSGKQIFKSQELYSGKAKYPSTRL